MQAYDKYAFNPRQQYENRMQDLMTYRALMQGLPTSTYTDQTNILDRTSTELENLIQQELGTEKKPHSFLDRLQGFGRGHGEVSDLFKPNSIFGSFGRRPVTRVPSPNFGVF